MGGAVLLTSPPSAAGVARPAGVASSSSADLARATSAKFAERPFPAIDASARSNLAREGKGPDAIIARLLDVISECVEYLNDLKSEEDRRRLRAALNLRSDRATLMLAMILAADGAGVKADQLAQAVLGKSADDVVVRKMVSVYIHDVRTAIRARWPKETVRHTHQNGYNIDRHVIAEILELAGI